MLAVISAVSIGLSTFFGTAVSDGGFSGIFVVLSSKTCGDSQSFLHTASQSSHNSRDGHSLGKKQREIDIKNYDDESV